MCLDAIYFSAPVLCVWKVKSIVEMVFVSIERLFVTELATAQTTLMRGKLSYLVREVLKCCFFKSVVTCFLKCCLLTKQMSIT